LQTTVPITIYGTVAILCCAAPIARLRKTIGGPGKSSASQATL